ncbi:spore coat U domain-containing protein [Amylibacter sp.]|jgi:spore coat protein U-like protein|nr:spore coat U domain-containing protein [Amylibacter sp.]MDB4017507.1 spore coat U domain-containing protein [Amylibacter sp.]MDC0096671.1 spore coat U domain-containing protein [Amylibacter sp.]
MKIFISLKSRFFQTCHTAHYNPSYTFPQIIKLKALAPWLIVLALALIGQQARACSLNVTEVNFGSYDVFSNVAVHSAGSIEVNCANGIGYTIAIGAGSGNYSQRSMRSDTHTLSYNLYTAANRAVVWGEATNGSATVSGIGTGQSVNHVVYGSIPPNQNVTPGSYSDTITVVITY